MIELEIRSVGLLIIGVVFFEFVFDGVSHYIGCPTMFDLINNFVAFRPYYFLNITNVLFPLKYIDIY